MSAAIGTFANILALVPAQADLLREIRAVVLAGHPDAVEVSRPGDRAVSWGWGEKKMSEAYAYAMPFPAYVNLGFYRGAELPDPSGLLKGTGKALRHVRISTADDLAAPALLSLIAAARHERAVALGRLSG